VPGSGNRTRKESLSRKTLAPSFSLRETETQFITILCCRSGLNVGRGTSPISEVAVLCSWEKSKSSEGWPWHEMRPIERAKGKPQLGDHNRFDSQGMFGSLSLAIGLRILFSLAPYPPPPDDHAASQ